MPDFGHFVVKRGFVDGGLTAVYNDSYPEGGFGLSAEVRRNRGNAATANWEKFDASWASSVDKGYDPITPEGHIRWAMAVE